MGAVMISELRRELKGRKISTTEVASSTARSC
jgi:hypothetical protein